MTISTPSLEVQLEKGAEAVPLDETTLALFRRRRILNACVFVCNVIAVSIPGRLDGGNEIGEDLQNPGPVNYVTPSSYAFIIWAPIYLTEAAFVLWQLSQEYVFKNVPDRRLAMIHQASLGWCAGNAAQVLWCATFRPPLDTFATLWVSSIFLTATPIGLSFAHQAAVTAEGVLEYVFMLMPITLHFGWTTAAALVNWNSWVSLGFESPSVKLAALACSLAVAASVGVGVSAPRRAGGYACVVAWAVFWVGIGTRSSEAIAEELGESRASILAWVELAIAGGLVLFGLSTSLAAQFQPKQIV